MARADRYSPDPEALWGGCPEGLRWAEDLLDRMGLPPGGLVLDLGAGPGLTAVFIAKEYACRVVAAEAWPQHFPLEAILARAREHGVDDRVLPVVAEAQRLPFAEGSFDAVFSYCAFHYLAGDATACREVARVLKPGGVLGICSPAARVAEVPAHILPVLAHDRWDLFKPPEWTAARLAGAGLAIVLAEHLEDGYSNWRRRKAGEEPSDEAGRVARQAVLEDGGHWLSVARVIARQRGDERNPLPVVECSW
ncbi:MAG: class I SAM-dependent methyltransferase [bacterium]|nr:class I SAM-dependent methyltransferase [bacterium]